MTKISKVSFTDKARAVLITRAIARDVITFQALADAIGFTASPISLNGIMHNIHNEALEAGEPSLATLVVSGDDLAKPAAWTEFTVEEWNAERRKVYALYRNTRVSSPHRGRAKK